MMPAVSDLLQALAISIAASLPQPAPEADLVFAGDAMQHAAQIETAHALGHGFTYDYSECFATIRPYIEHADYAVVNLETPLGGAPYSGYPCFSAPDSYARALQDCGFDLMLTANNHTLDRRDHGLRRTIAVLDTLGIDHIGTYNNDSLRECAIPLIRDIKGFRVGFLNYTYGTNGFKPTDGVIVDYIDTIKIKEDIAATRAASAELIAINIHWGDEYVQLPGQAQKQLAQWLAQQGVEMIIGSHPHVVQPARLTHPATGTVYRQLTVYSLGNFISNMRTVDTRGGIILNVHLKRDPSGRAYVHSATYKPVFTLPPSAGHNFRLVDASIPVTDSPWDYHRQLFLRNTADLVDRHNVNVPLDSTAWN